MKLAKMPDGSPEIFHTLQGEGRNIGMPSVFVRSSLCNLHCHWCDTPYTWNWEDSSFEHIDGVRYSRRESIIDLEVPELARRLNEFPCSNFVFTGGEPLIQESDWLDLMERLIEYPGSRSRHFEIETNGTLAPGERFLELITQINVSPKLENSRVDASKRINSGSLRRLVESEKADFKFVIASRSDWTEIESLITTIPLPRDRVFLMPKANTVAELETNQRFVAEFAREQECRFSDRLHLRLFGARRGV